MYSKYTKYLTHSAFYCKLQSKIMSMKKIFFSLLLGTTLLTCSKSNINDSNCKFLLNVGVNVSINTNLPQYNQLEFPSNSVYYANAGNRGIIITNTGTGYTAFDAADPNHTPSSCSTLTISGIIGTCGCTDANEYELISGQPLGNSDLRCALKAYRVSVSGSNLIITN